MRNGPYELVIAPPNYPGKLYRNRYIYEHHLVWWINTGEILTKGQVIHHKNENTRDNRYLNLEKKDNKQHVSDHSKPIELTIIFCSWCNQEFTIEAKNFRAKSKAGQTNFYCCRSHQAKDAHRNKKKA